MANNEFKFEIVKKIAAIRPTNDKGWTREVNLVSYSEVLALGVNLKDDTTFTDTYITPCYKDKVSALKYLQKEYNNNKIKNR